ncbi:glycoside hydrolase superfamily [Jimgerdemannia flammicorona]|uniref:chitinase n=1 Tax=Jimgerdemannia flammicorona TaxID=994334 RepID=A0A433D3Z2_9FUNG|nr:glycoside hydrolase superfamily [Jimgerdemannia flammicorona]
MARTAFFLGALAATFLKLAQASWNSACTNNVLAYHGNSAAPNGQNLKSFCDNENAYTDVFIQTFIPHRDSNGQPVFQGSGASCTVTGNCGAIGNDVKHCQSIGKTVLISIGGQTGDIVFSSAGDAQDFAQKMWNAYLGGNGNRPFGAGVKFDGVDLDIENHDPPYWGDFTTKLRALYATDQSKKYLISSAPQPEPIESQYQVTPDLLKNAWVDIAFIQFYNNPGFDGPDTLNRWGWWDSWARQSEQNGFNSKNPNVKLVYGLPGSPAAAGHGYMQFSEVRTNVAAIKKQWPQSFGGGGTWDDAYSYANTENGVNYLQNFKNAVGSCSSTPTPPPPTTGCTKYTVQSGDTCSKIATKFGISPWTKLIQWNPSINSNCANLAVGQVICVSGTTAAHSCPNQGAVCPSSSPCCSQFGYCGSSSDHCGTGCDPAASFNGKCSASVAMRVVSQHNSSTVNTNQFLRNPVGGSVNDMGNYKVLVAGLPSTKKDTSAFEIRVVAGKVPIKKNWSLTLLANSGVISSNRGVVKKTNTGISILSEPNKEEESVGSIRFVVEAKINVKQINLSRAKFSSK